MISEVVMPQMGADMTEGTIVRWLKGEGDEVQRGEIIAEIETDKANVEIEAFESGVFRKVLANEGDTIDVGAVIAVIASPEEDLSKYEAAAVGAKAAPEAQPAEAKASAPAEAPAEGVPIFRPAARRVRATPSVQQPAEQPAPPPPSTDGRVRASPVARKLAQESGIDLSQVRGSGPDGRIVRRDVEAAIERPPAGAAAPAAEAPPAERAAPAAAPMSRMRQAIARRMAQSKREAPHYYVTMDVDMTQAEQSRHQLNDHFKRQLHLSVHDLVLKATAMALTKHPAFNTWFVDGEARQHEAANICLAIAVDEGLIAPAVLNCEAKSLTEIAEATRNLAERAKSGVLKAEELSAGTFTVTSLELYGVDTLIAIIQPPQTAILGLGSVRTMPVVRDGRIEPAEVLKVALSADHRVTDGVQGALFLREIRRILERPAVLLV